MRVVGIVAELSAFGRECCREFRVKSQRRKSEFCGAWDVGVGEWVSGIDTAQFELVRGLGAGRAALDRVGCWPVSASLNVVFRKFRGAGRYRRIQVAESEEVLIQQARDAVSQCNWVVGECAAKWTARYARGRTDADFGQLVGLSGDQIFQRRRVWERFGSVYADYPGLKWSFFYVALNWDDAPDCLAWAREGDATVAEMRAWRRAQRGEDLFTESAEGYSEWAAPLGVDTSEVALSRVVDPSEYVQSGQGDRAGLGGARSGAATMDAVARDAADSSYAPFRADAGGGAPKVEGSEPGVRRAELTPEQFWKRASSMLDKLSRALTPGLLKALPEQSDAVQEKLREALRELSERLDEVLD